MEKNYKRDHYLQRIADEEQYVDLTELIQFNKMKTIGANLKNCLEVLEEGNFKNFEVRGQKVRAK